VGNRGGKQGRGWGREELDTVYAPINCAVTSGQPWVLFLIKYGRGVKEIEKCSQRRGSSKRGAYADGSGRLHQRASALRFHNAGGV